MITGSLRRKLWAATAALVAFASGTAGAAFLYLLLGFVTGIFGMCSTAPEWWATLYFRSTLALPVCGLLFALYAYRWMYRMCL